MELVQPAKKTAGMREVKEVISAMQNSPTAGYLQELSLHERIMLAAVLKCVKREGVEEVKWGDVRPISCNHLPIGRIWMHADYSLLVFRFNINMSFTRVF